MNPSKSLILSVCFSSQFPAAPVCSRLPQLSHRTGRDAVDSEKSTSGAGGGWSAGDLVEGLCQAGDVLGGDAGHGDAPIARHVDAVVLRQAVHVRPT